VTLSWDEGLPGARAFRLHRAWHSLGHLPDLDQPGTASWLLSPQEAHCHWELLNIDAQDKQDYWLMVWSECSGTSSSPAWVRPLLFLEQRFFKKRSQALGSLHRQTRSATGWDSCAAANGPVNPVYPVHRCFL